MDHKSEIEKNPFAVSTPENLSSQEITSLFVPYPEYENLQNTGHQFLDGHRGSGKSMMLRMMCPDCQMLIKNQDINQLAYFAVYISIKQTNINNPEYTRIEQEIGGTVLSEHLLTTILLSNLVSSMQKYTIDNIKNNNLDVALSELINKKIINIFKYAGWKTDSIKPEALSIYDNYTFLIEILDEIFASTIQYIKRRAFTPNQIPYEGVLFGFQDTLLSIVRIFEHSGILPNNIPVYFLLDDADNLTLQQTKILNTWVSYRSTDLVSLKISTQLNYKTYETISGIRIKSPHDFSKIEFTSIRTGSKKEKYPELIKEIIEKRLKLYGITNPNAYDFFTVDKQQVEQISAIALDIKDNWKAGLSGYRPGDDAYRYARPEYIRRLSGNSKQGHRYSYSGFEQLVHISSGIVRYFLEPASYMFADQLVRNAKEELVTFIEPSIQDNIIRKEANKLAFDSFDEISNEFDLNNDHVALQIIKKLQNLIWGLGEIFKAHILDPKASQRRLFSFTISGNSTDLLPILKLGIEHGYFYTDIRGSRDGLGSEVKYVLTRRLAAAFSLDPIGFSGDKSLSAEKLLALCLNPKAYTNKLRTSGLSALADSRQLSLLEGGDIE